MEPTTRSMKTSVDVDAMNQLPETSPIWRRVRTIADRHAALDRVATEAVSLCAKVTRSHFMPAVRLKAAQTGVVPDGCFG